MSWDVEILERLHTQDEVIDGLEDSIELIENDLMNAQDDNDRLHLEIERLTRDLRWACQLLAWDSHSGSVARAILKELQ